MRTFDELPDIDREHLTHIASLFHHRDRVKFMDGSIGSVRITYKELRSILVEAYSAGVKSANKAKSE